jgi:azurin
MKRLLVLAIAALLFVVAGCKGTAELALGTVGNTMVYDQTSLTVKAGQKVHLVLKNNGSTQAMQHNWVLAKAGTEAAVAEAGGQAGAGSNYVKPNDPNVIASTPISAPDTSTEVIFTAPDPGSYPFLCTFPGHAATMKGILTVTP